MNDPFDTQRVLAIRQWIVDIVPCNEDAAKHYLSTASFSEQMIAYITWVDRLIRPTPREILMWPGFHIHSLLHCDLELWAPVIEKIQMGGDLSGHLSDKVKTGFVLKYNGKKKRIDWVDNGGAKDLALNASGVHHLHLHPIRKSGNRRGHSDLLFMIFDKHNAYPLMIGNHTTFKGALTEAFAAFEVWRGGMVLKGILGPSPERTTEENMRLMRSGISTITKVGDQSVMTSSLTSSGHSIFHIRHADRILDAIQFLEPRWDTDMGRQEIEQRIATAVPKGEYGYGLDYAHFGAFEVTGGQQICSVPYQR